MAIVGFSFTRMLGEKLAPIKGKININNNVSLLSVDDAHLSMAQGKQGVRVHFVFESKYEPQIGRLHMEGDVILLEDAKVVEDMLKQWKEKQVLPQAVITPVLNNILERSNVQALILARDLNLPSPVPLPKASIQLPKGAPAKAEKPAAKKAPEKKAKK